MAAGERGSIAIGIPCDAVLEFLMQHKRHKCSACGGSGDLSRCRGPATVGSAKDALEWVVAQLPRNGPEAGRASTVGRGFALIFAFESPGHVGTNLVFRAANVQPRQRLALLLFARTPGTRVVGSAVYRWLPPSALAGSGFKSQHPTCLFKDSCRILVLHLCVSSIRTEITILFQVAAKLTSTSAQSRGVSNLV